MARWFNVFNAEGQIICEILAYTEKNALAQLGDTKPDAVSAKPMFPNEFAPDTDDED